MYHDVSDLDDIDLDKEIFFAEKSLDGTTTTIGWLMHLVREKERRLGITSES